MPRRRIRTRRGWPRTSCSAKNASSFYAKFGRLPTRGDVPTNPPGIVERITQKQVVATLFDPPEEARLRQTFNTLFRQR